MDSDKETGDFSDGIERASSRTDISATNKDPNAELSKGQLQDEKNPHREASIQSSAGSTRVISDIPNGGIVAWLQVVGSFFLFFNSWGIVNTFGVYQTFYQGNFLSSESPSNISWIGAIQAYLLLLISVVVGPLFDAGHFRSLLLVGTFFAVFGMMMVSISTNYWQVMLAQALCIGIGCGCLFVPSVAIVPTYFTTKKALATGIAASGSSLGGVIYPIIFHKLQPKIGFGWTTRTIGFVILATLIISISTMKMRIKPAQKRKLIDLSALKDRTFVIFILAMFFGFLGLYFPFFYVQSYSISEKIMSEDLAFYLLSVLNAGSILGRIFPNWIADKVGPLNVLIPAVVASCILVFAWIGIKNTAGIMVFVFLYGFFSGSFVSIPPTVIVTLSPNLSVVGGRMGMCFGLGGLGLLIGTPVAGQIVNHAGYTPAIAFSGACIALGAALCYACRFSKVGLNPKHKA